MWSPLSFLVVLSVVFEYVSGLYFHIGETERKCFIEEIPDETAILGINLHLFDILVYFYFVLKVWSRFF